jgi:hypothetical protein
VITIIRAQEAYRNALPETRQRIQERLVRLLHNGYMTSDLATEAQRENFKRDMIREAVWQEIHDKPMPVFVDVPPLEDTI